MDKRVKIHDKYFKVYLSEDTIKSRVVELGAQITNDYKGEDVLVIGIMNGVFVFAADLFRNIDNTQAQISFVKLSSYQGLQSTGDISTSIGLKEPVKGRHVLLLEDIIDSGETLNNFLPQLKAQDPASIKIVSLLYKPSALKYNIKADYIGFEIPNAFVLGYGLDYDGLGRGLPDIYVLDEG